MSELENIVHHIVQHEEKRQAEKIKLESEIKALEEVLEHGISTKFVEDEVIYIYSPKTAHDMRGKLYENYKQLHVQLTIPKSIADWLDKAFEEYSEEGRMVSTILTMQIIRNVSKHKDIEEWFMKYNIERLNLALAYLAGKALGVDLVKVVADD